MAAHATQTLDRIEEPGLAAHGEIEATITVRHDVEPCCLLFGDDAGDRVKVLLAEQRIAERRLEGAARQAAVKPNGARVGTCNGGGQDCVAGDSVHRMPPWLAVNDAGPPRLFCQVLASRGSLILTTASAQASEPWFQRVW